MRSSPPAQSNRETCRSRSIGDQCTRSGTGADLEASQLADALVAHASVELHPHPPCKVLVVDVHVASFGGNRHGKHVWRTGALTDDVDALTERPRLHLP